MIQLLAENLQVKYERQVALSIDALSISGRILAVLGHNGAGKSTLLKTLLGLLAPQRGSLIALSSNQEKLRPERDMAFCPENGAVFEDISIADYLRIWLRLRAKDDSLKNSRVSHLLELFEVDPLLNKFGRELSKGQRRRVQSVVGFLIEPKLFLFDEPFDGLDVQRTAELADILEVHKEKTAFIISSHRMDVIERVVDAGVVLADGKVAATGQIAELSSQLAGKSFSLNGAEIIERSVTKEIADSLGAYVTHIGEQVVVTGPNLNTQLIQEFLASKNLRGYAAREFNPTLTDAMGYHLQSRKVIRS